MDSIKEQVRALYAKANDEERRQIQADIRELQTSLDEEWDALLRLTSGPFQMSLAQIGVELPIFTLVSSSSTPVTLSTLSEKTGAAPILLSHLLRAMASFGLLKEPSPDTFSASTMTHRLANPHVQGALPHIAEVHNPVYQILPQWFKEHKYQDIKGDDLPFHAALNTKLPPFQWMQQHPEQLKALGHAMAIQRPISWIDSYPVLREAQNFSAPPPDSALLVDVGGGFGHQASAFHSKFPELQGRTVVQDIPGTLAAAPAIEGIEFQAHDFFIEQPIKGAKFYYLRHILHDWSDEDSVKILQAIAPAMGSESKIVIDEIVLPDKDVPWQCALMDIVMLSCLGGRERTRGEWEKLLEAAGFKIVDVHKYDTKMQSVILAVPK